MKRVLQMNTSKLFSLPVVAGSEDAALDVQPRFQQDAPAKNDYTPKYFNQMQFRMIEQLCEAIIPADDKCGGACQAGAAQFVDVAAHGNRTTQIRLSGAL